MFIPNYDRCFKVFEYLFNNLFYRVLGGGDGSLDFFLDPKIPGAALLTLPWLIESCIKWENIFRSATAKPKKLELGQNARKQTMLHMFISSYIRKHFEVEIYLNGKV